MNTIGPVRLGWTSEDSCSGWGVTNGIRVDDRDQTCKVEGPCHQEKIVGQAIEGL